MAGQPSRRFLCVAHDFPIPADNGSSVRVIGLVRMLAGEGPVRLVATMRPTTSAAEVAEVESVPGLQLLRLPPQTPARSGPALWARAMATRTPPWFIQWFDAGVLDTLRAQLGWATHVVALDDFAAHYLPRLQPSAAVRTVVDKHKVYAAAAARGERRDDFGARVRDAALRPIIRHDERRVLDHAHSVIVTTPEEAERLERAHGRQPDAVVPTCVEIPARPWEPPASGPPTAVWLGTLDSRPNRDGLVRLLGRIRDRRDRQGSMIRLLVVGKGADEEIRDMVDGLDVELLGYVDDLDDVLGVSHAALVPLWSGGGIRVKTLTLLAAGMPVVATPAAVEGVAVETGRHCALVTTVDELLDATDRVLADPEAARRMGQEGRRLIAERYTWSSWRSELSSAVLGSTK